MNQFERPLVGYRLVEILHGDTLQEIAARELKDATRWVDLANINRLLPPYITGDTAQAGARVKLYGELLQVPAVTQQSPSRSTDIEAVYETDVELRDGFIDVNEAGDLATVSGWDNLKQAIDGRLETETGELLFHPEYGCRARTLIGMGSTPVTGQLCAQYVRASLRADPRISDIDSTTAEVDGDTLRVEAVVIPISGRSLKIEKTL